jgi:hypothetical protein
MSFHNGIPITVVSALQSVSMPTDSTSRHRVEDDAHLDAMSRMRLRLRRSARPSEACAVR